MNRNFSLYALLIVAACLSLPGCGGSDGPLSLDDLEARERRRANPANLTEVELGEFMVTRRTGDQMIILVRFQVFGLVDADKVNEFNTALEKRREWMRDRVLTAALETELDHFNQANLRVLKAEISMAVKKALKAPQLEDVAFASFNVEQS